MKTQQAQVYVAFDGRAFFDPQACEAHEQALIAHDLIPVLACYLELDQYEVTSYEEIAHAIIKGFTDIKEIIEKER